MKEILYHPRVPFEAREFLKYYEDINPDLGDRFWTELFSAIDYAGRYPERHHFDLLGVGLRRSNLKGFPVHFLFRVFPNHIRVTVVRHHKSRPTLGSRRR